MKQQKLERVTKALEISWSLKSSTKWKKTNPALGQCGVTALVAQDYLGGEIIKTWVEKPGGIALWHYYNLVENQSIDFTISQFDEAIDYDNIPSSREEAFSDTNITQYAHLKSAVQTELDNA